MSEKPLKKMETVSDAGGANKEDEEDDEDDTIHTDLDHSQVGADLYKMLEIDNKLIGRKYRGKYAKVCMIYPDDSFRSIWDMICTV